jgi:hypothetical protein
VADHVAALRMQVARQVAHWTMAVSRMQNLEAFASPSAWSRLERYLGVALRQNLAEAVSRLQEEAAVPRARFDAAPTEDDLERVRSQVVAFRQRYARTETLVDFYSDAVNTRMNPDIAALLRACDVMAVRSMAQMLDPLGKTTSPMLTYVDKGLGASILKAGLRLWEGGTLSAVAAVKITFHSLFRPIALIHETGHQAAHITGWNDELAEALRGASTGYRGTWRRCGVAGRRRSRRIPLRSPTPDTPLWLGCARSCLGKMPPSSNCARGTRTLRFVPGRCTALRSALPKAGPFLRRAVDSRAPDRLPATATTLQL